MSFSGVEFAFFFPVVFLLYWLLPRRAALQNLFLLAASYFFYVSWSPRLFVVLLGATAIDYLAALYIHENRASPSRMRLGLAASLVYNLGQLAFFKYSGFFAESLNGLLAAAGIGAELPILRILLPLGLSFYTFQKLSYILDVYHDRLPPCRSLLTFATFVAFFPQLIAGPIVRGGELLPQLEAPRRLSADLVKSGAAIFFLGFFKKAYVADYLAKYVVDPIFAHPSGFSTAGHWLALVGYAVQVFCDFSGYSEMAIGTARLLGIELPQNFNYPFLSKTLLEFWRRWHITLNTWFFDYIYGPMTTGESWLRGRLGLSFMVVFLASGLWHGARWTFIAWGAMHGVGLVIHYRYDAYYRGLCRRDRSFVALRRRPAYGAAAWLLTQTFFLLSLVPFRSDSLAKAAAFFRRLWVPQGGRLLPEFAPHMRSLSLAVCAAFIVAYHLLELPRGQKLVARFFALPAPLRGAAYGLIVVYLNLFVPVSSGTFIYAQF